MTTKILVLADLHGGSKYGVATSDWVSDRIKGRSHCLEMLEQFNRVRDDVGKVDRLFLLGDLADGANPKEQGKDRIGDDDDQVEMICQLIRTVRGSPKIRVVEGTLYHGGVARLDKQIAEKLGAEKDQLGNSAPKFWLGNIDGVRFSLAHKITVSQSSWQYRTTPLALRLVLTRLNKQEDPSRHMVLIRAHCHTYQGVFFKRQMGVTCPGLEARTPFGEERNPENNPDVGGLFFDVSDDNYHMQPYAKSIDAKVYQL